jgi:hypothetical protein
VVRDDRERFQPSLGQLGHPRTVGFGQAGECKHELRSRHVLVDAARAPDALGAPDGEPQVLDDPGQSSMTLQKTATASAAIR